MAQHSKVQNMRKVLGDRFDFYGQSDWPGFGFRSRCVGPQGIVGSVVLLEAAG